MTATETALPLAERRDIPPDAVLWMGKANGWATQHFTTNRGLTLYVRPVATALRKGVELVNERGTVFASSFYVETQALMNVEEALACKQAESADGLVERILAAIARTAENARTTAGGGGLPDPQWTTQPSRSGKWKILREVDDATPIGYIDDGRWEVRHIVRNDPATVLLRCAADRRTVERHQHEIEPNVFFDILADGQEDRRDVEYCGTCTLGVSCGHCVSWNGQSSLDEAAVLWPCPTIRDLAEVYGVPVELVNGK